MWRIDRHRSTEFAVVFLLAFVALAAFVLWGPRNRHVDVRRLIHDEVPELIWSKHNFSCLTDWSHGTIIPEINRSGPLASAGILDRCLMRWNSFEDAMNPRISKYIIGFLDFSVSRFHPSTDTYILVMHLLMALMSAAAVVGVYALCGAVSRPTGIAGVVLILANPVFLSISYVVHSIVPMFLFSVAALVFLQKIDFQLKAGLFSTGHVITAGLFTGLAIGSRLYSLPLIPMFLSVLILNYRRLTLKRACLWVFAFSAVSLGVFIISNPGLYSDFMSGIRDMTVGKVAKIGTRPGQSDLFGGILSTVRTSLMLVSLRPFGIGALHPPETPEYCFMFLGAVLILYRIVSATWKAGALSLIWIGLNVCFMSVISSRLVQIPGAYMYSLITLGLVWFCSGAFVGIDRERSAEVEKTAA